MATFTLQINGKPQQVDVDPNTPLLWVLRDHLGMVGTKYGCGIAQCGVCTVHLNGTAIRSCNTPVSRSKALIIQRNTIIQCKQCKVLLKPDSNTTGKIRLWGGLLLGILAVTGFQIAGIETAMNGNICRCGTYVRIKAAVKTAAKMS